MSDTSYIYDILSDHLLAKTKWICDEFSFGFVSNGISLITKKKNANGPDRNGYFSSSSREAR
jgi:hypothetical protein